MTRTPLKLQVACPAYTVTGGPEALHQLVHVARGLGIDARIVYLSKDPDSSRPLTADPFRIYDLKIDEQIDDSRDVVLVVPETETQLLPRFRRLRKAIWWLSVDNYHVAAANLHDSGRRRRWWKSWQWWKRPMRAFDLQLPDRTVVHLAQSEYARAFLQAHGLDKVCMLTDYLRDDFLVQVRRVTVDKKPRPPRVAYNPKKGFETTQLLSQRAGGDLEFVPIQNMSPGQVIDLLCSSAVYMDFGHHPGRDRIPREAAACGCCVLTGRKGAAANPIDIPIPDDFKLDETRPDFPDHAVAALRRLAAGHAEVTLAFEPYRAVILAQKRTFEEEVRAFMALVSDSGRA
jgi:hypothetical protein